MIVNIQSRSPKLIKSADHLMKDEVKEDQGAYIIEVTSLP